ncbi:M24 family metallopeptidase [Peribacillus cavernae]|uniref:M24 family metallopeptidase n=1 Tax=Peribacillus cavernae TaxID=1674310 RepID=A0A3S0U1D3_9BACI|nr:M24 family metallopeptidase [Peribacillus cavernae]MDQ0220000.1 Xaa-Pro aminopeptidase [Peribacillus cavernae]RUQ32064.1 M24 family metallopeptidase [Peribacillus cavernae]
MTVSVTPLQKVKDFMKQKEIDGVLFRTRSNFSWLTGGKDNHIVHTTELGVADLLILPEKKYCITSKMESARIHDEELIGLDYEFIATEWYENQDKAIEKLCEGKTIASDVPFSHFLDFGRELTGLRFTLNEKEINRYRLLSQKAAGAVESTCREIEPGMTEFEIAAHLAAKVMKDGMNPHVILVSTDDRVFKYRHPIPTEKKLEEYAMIVLCAEKGGLVSNVTRFVHFGALPEELAVNKGKLMQIDVAMNAVTRPGTPIKDVLQKGFDTYSEVGYPDDWRYLHQGGPTGYATREFIATPDMEDIVHLHQAFAWNPAIRGIKSEDTILVGEDDNEVLTHTGEWVYLETEHNGKKYLRPDILIR